MNWLLNIFRRDGLQTPLRIGSRVRTEVGSGVITHGSVSVKYDEGTRFPKSRRHPNDRTMAHNLDKIEFL